MKPIYDAGTIQVEITNFCNKKCQNCSRFCGHYEKPYFMKLEVFAKALKSLEGFKHMVGVMGGEPTLHPLFKEICELLRIYIPKERRGLWTNGAQWKRYESIIRETFPIENVVYNAHDYEYKGQHQPILIASKEIISDERLRFKLINSCWVQERWSPSINPNGAYFCEIAAAMGMLFDIKGWNVEEGWWNKKVSEFQDQVETFCSRCSMCIPFNKFLCESKHQYISEGNLKLFTESNTLNLSRFKVYLKEYSEVDYKRNVEDWKPGIFREFKQFQPNERVYE